MELKVYRFSSQSQTTLGALHINGEFECYTLEDQHQDMKVRGETRIPKGKYKIALRTVGGFHAKYSKKFPNTHKGMLQVMNVPNFEYILIHVGNDEDDTMGCLLVGLHNNNKIDKGQISSSTTAYKTMYTKVLKALESGLDVTIEYIDL